MPSRRDPSVDVEVLYDSIGSKWVLIGVQIFKLPSCVTRFPDEGLVQERPVRRLMMPGLDARVSSLVGFYQKSSYASATQYYIILFIHNRSPADPCQSHFKRSSISCHAEHSSHNV